jgi:hypothetical protein
MGKLVFSFDLFFGTAYFIFNDVINTGSGKSISLTGKGESFFPGRVGIFFIDSNEFNFGLLVQVPVSG